MRKKLRKLLNKWPYIIIILAVFFINSLFNLGYTVRMEYQSFSYHSESIELVCALNENSTNIDKEVYTAECMDNDAIHTSDFGPMKSIPTELTFNFDENGHYYYITSISLGNALFDYITIPANQIMGKVVSANPAKELCYRSYANVIVFFPSETQRSFTINPGWLNRIKAFNIMCFMFISLIEAFAMCSCMKWATNLIKAHFCMPQPKKELSHKSKVVVFSKHIAVTTVLALYFVIEIVYIVASYGNYAFDEFYALGSANTGFNTLYDRAYYLNLIVRAVGKLPHTNYYSYRAIPFVVGLLSICAILVLLYFVCENAFPILLAGVFIVLSPCFIFNHMYIRFYVFEELAYAMATVFLYMYFKESQNKKSWLFILLSTLSMALFSVFTKDESAYAFLAVYIVSALLCVVIKTGKIAVETLFRLGYIVASICVICAIPIVLFVKFGQYNNHILEKVAKIICFYQNDSPVFLFFILSTYLCMFVSVLYLGIKIPTDEKYYDIIPVWFMATLPLAAYLLLFFNNNLIRTYIPYMTSGVICFAVCFDRENVKKATKVAICCALVGSIAISYADWSVNEPAIKDEVYFPNYSEVVNELDRARNNGYEVVTLFAMIQQDYYLVPYEHDALSVIGDNNHRIHSHQYVIDALNRICTGDKKIALVINSGADAILKDLHIVDDFRELYPYSIYDGFNVIFYFN